VGAHDQAGVAVIGRRMALWIALGCAVRPIAAQRVDSSVVARNDSVSIRLIDVDVRAAVQALARYLDRPVVFGTITASRVTIETPTPVPATGVLQLLRGVLQTQNLELIEEQSMYRVRAREQAPVPAAPSPAQAQQGPIELFIVRLRHAKAADVAATVNALYGQASALGELGAMPPSLGEQLRQQQVPPVGAQPQARPGAQVQSGALTGDVTIVPEPRANSLLIRASRADFDILQAAIQQIDVRPLQVLIEVQIAEVRKDRNFDLGIDATMPKHKVGSGNASVQGSVTGGGLGDFVLRLMSFGAIDIDATLRAAEARGDVSIVSRPVIITANNKRAEIVVGSERPFVQVSRSLPTDSPLRDAIIQYRQVGTRLFVIPTISDDGFVMLEVLQEVNAATTETAFNAPVISTRSVQTNLLIRDGQTVALGGLSDRQRDVNQQGVPLLSRIPLLGGLFGRASRRATETELFLFITPRLMRNDEDAQDLTAPLLERAKKVKP